MDESKPPEKPAAPRDKNGGTPHPNLGPVAHLEDHVPPEWWRFIFNSLYLKTDADVVADEQITEHEVDVLVTILQPDNKTHILDLCCGQGRHTLSFARRGFHNIEGLDRSRYLIRKARKQAHQEGLNIRFREGDARKIPHPDDSFDVVMILGNSFGYFDSVDDDLRVLREVFRVLKPEGKLVLDLSDGDYLRKNYQARTWEWADRNHFVCRERELSSDARRLITREIISHTEKGVIADQFYAERLYGRESITRLVKSVGFSEVEHHEGFAPISQRNQDLGMMAQRILLTCTTPKPWALTPDDDVQALQHVAVVFGDPHQRDEIKPNAVFDEDDFHTIDQLKAALEDGTPCSYTYLDNHDTLIQDLHQIMDSIDMVFNLCDEGFNNDPSKELHVPALLEILHIPYSGAGPQCLAFCYDKSLVRGVAHEMGIPIPEGMLIEAQHSTFDLPMSFPVIVKPNFGDSSFGIITRSVVHSPEDYIESISEIRRRFGYEKPILVEQFLPGQDLSVGIIGNPSDEYTILPIIQEDYSVLPEGLPHICGYEAKWLPDSPYWKLRSIPAELTEETRNLIEDSCVKLFARLDCRDYARFDWRLDGDGNPKLLEVNPNPGWCWDGHMAKMAFIAGMTYPDMLQAILRAAMHRVRAGKRSQVAVGP